MKFRVESTECRGKDEHEIVERDRQTDKNHSDEPGETPEPILSRPMSLKRATDTNDHAEPGDSNSEDHKMGEKRDPEALVQQPAHDGIRFRTQSVNICGSERRGEVDP